MSPVDRLADALAAEEQLSSSNGLLITATTSATQRVALESPLDFAAL